MLKVLPIQDKAEQEKLCTICNIKYRANSPAYSAEMDGEIVGICQFSTTSEGGVIYDLAPVPSKYNFGAMFTMGRAALNFIDLCGVHRAFFDGDTTSSADTAEEGEKLIKAIGFSANEEGRYYVDLTNFFSHPCKN